MGRTQLQDAVPMTLGQEFESYAASLEGETPLIRQAVSGLLEINMGATAIGTGINSDPAYAYLTPKARRKGRWQIFSRRPFYSLKFRAY